MSPQEAPPSLQDPASPWERQALLWAVPLLLLLAALDAAFFRTGFTAYDEESQLDLLQAAREGLDPIWRYGSGSLHRSMIVGLFGLFGPNEAWLRLPAMLGVAAEAMLLYLWLKPRLGERAAVWACLADLVCTATFARARCMLAPALLPAVFLAHAVWLERLRKPWHHALYGLSLALWTLDYEGWMVGLACVIPLWAWRHLRGAGAIARLACLLAAFGAAAALIVAYSPSFTDYALTRAGVSKPDQGLAAQAWQNLRDLVLGGSRLAFSAADQHPWPAPWIWPLCLAGAVPLWRKDRSFGWLLAVGATPLVLRWTSAEPHRLSLALLALSAMAGAGAAWIWRKRALRWALPLLLLAGVIHEAWAWTHVDKVHLAYGYGRSQNLKAAARWLRDQAPAQGWEVLDGLGPYHDGSFRLLLDMQSVERKGTVPVALVHWDYLPALKGLKGRTVAIDGSGYLPIYLYFPVPSELPRLRALRAELAPLQQLHLTAYPGVLQKACLKRLRDRSLTDPWARTVYWDAWMHANLMLNDVDPKLAHAAAREPLVSGWIFDALAKGLEGVPAAKKAFAARAEAADPRRAKLEYPFMLY